MKSRGKEARERQAHKERLGQMRRKGQYSIAYWPEAGYSDRGRWIVSRPSGWYVQDYLSGTGPLGPFRTEKLARVALNRHKKTK